MEPPSTSGRGGFEGHANPRDDSDWHFLQCFGERTPGEEIQDGTRRRKREERWRDGGGATVKTTEARWKNERSSSLCIALSCF
jgi:hypothetical protein